MHVVENELFVPDNYERIILDNGNEPIVAFQLHHRDSPNEFVYYEKVEIGRCSYWMLNIKNLHVDEHFRICKVVDTQNSVSFTFTECQTILAFIVENSFVNDNYMTRKIVSRKNGVEKIFAVNRQHSVFDYVTRKSISLLIVDENRISSKCFYEDDFIGLEHVMNFCCQHLVHYRQHEV